MKKIIFILIFMLNLVNINSMEKIDLIDLPDEVLLSIFDYIYFDFKSQLKIDNFFQLCKIFSKFGSFNKSVKNIRLVCKDFNYILKNYYLNKVYKLLDKQSKKFKYKVFEEYKGVKQEKINQKLSVALELNLLNTLNLPIISNMLFVSDNLGFKLDVYEKFLFFFISKKDLNFFVEFLIKFKNIDLNFKDEQGLNLLMHLILKNSEKYKDIIKSLINNSKVDINSQDSNGNTVLMLAVNMKNKDLIRLLLENKSIDLKIKNREKIDAFELAKNLADVEIIEILLNFLNLNKESSYKRFYKKFLR